MSAAAGRGGTLAVARLLVRQTVADRAAWALPVAAWTVVTALVLSVAGGAVFFFRTDGELGPLYRVLAIIALILLVLPLLSLGGSAARLATTRRDTRLSSLRLLGASAGTLRALTVGEACATALVGGLLGTLGYVALMPVLGLLHFTGRALGPTGTWLGWGPVLLAPLGVAVIAAVSSLLGLERVELSPLGVRTRADAPVLRWWLAALGLAAIGAAFLGIQLVARGAFGTAVLITITLAAFATPLVAIHLVGPWLLAVLARRDAARARSAVQLLAARQVLEDPRQVWRQLSSLGAVSFVAVFVGTGLTMEANTDTPAEAVLLGDLRTGVLLTLVLSFVTTAASSWLNQTAAVLDSRRLLVGLDLMGTPRGSLHAARSRALLRPLAIVLGLSVGSGLLLVAPLLGAQMVLDPRPTLAVLATVAAGLALQAVVLRASRGAVERVLSDGLARVD